MIKAEKIIGLIALAGLILKFGLLLPAGGILLTLALVLLADLYFIFGIALFNQVAFKQILKVESYKEIHKPYIIVSIGAGIALSIICIGVLFKLSHWPGSMEMLILGVSVLLISGMVLILRYIISRESFFIRVIKRILIIGSLGLILLCISDLTIARIQLRNNADYIRALDEYEKDPQNVELRKKVNMEYYKATVSKEEYDLYLKQNEAQ